MSKIDFKKTLKHLYAPSAKAPSRVTVPAMNFLMIDGQGDPDGSGQPFSRAIEALYALAYTLKFMAKEKGNDYVVPPLEGLWWSSDPSGFDANNRATWRWTAMIMQPEDITTKMVAQAAETVQRKKSPSALHKARFERFEDGNAAQILYIGPYDQEGPTIAALHKFITDQGGRLTGKHHEIYLNDPRKTAPEKLKTILRQPFASGS